MDLWSYGFAGTLYGLLAWRLLLRGYWRMPSEPGRRALVVALAASSAWALSLVAVMVLANRWLWTFGQLVDTLRYGFWYVFLLALLGARQSATTRAAAWPLASIAGALVGLALLSQAACAFGACDSGSAGHFVLLGSMVLPVMALVLLEQLYRNADEDARWSVKPLCLGLAGAFMFDLFLYSQAVLLGRADPEAFGIRGVAHLLLMPMLLMAASRHGNWTRRVELSRRAAFHSATLMIAGLYLLFLSGVAYYVRYFGGEWGRALQVAMVFLGLVALTVLAMSGAVRATLRVMLGKHFFRYRYDYRVEWLRFTHTLSGQHAEHGVGERVVRGLADMLDSPAGCLWIKDRGASAYRQAARWNMAISLEFEQAGSPLIRFMATSGWVVDLDEYQSNRPRYGDLVLPDWLEAMPQARLLVPLAIGGELIGFVVLAHSRARVDVNWEVNDLLKTAGRQAACWLAQMQVDEALLEVRKFDAFNRTSAFVVHDLKNVIAQMSLMLKNAQRLHANPEFQKDMLVTVESALDRMRQLMQQLRDGERPLGATLGVDLREIAQSMAQLAARRGREMEIVAVERVMANGHADRLTRVIGHLVNNALDATGSTDRVWLRLARGRDFAVVEVGDSGVGMTPEFVNERLFKPFQTSKTGGMGIGVYESYQYVQELGGRMTVQSRPAQGTRVTMLLPLSQLPRQAEPSVRVAA